MEHDILLCEMECCTFVAVNGEMIYAERYDDFRVRNRDYSAAGIAVSLECALGVRSRSIPLALPSCADWFWQLPEAPAQNEPAALQPALVLHAIRTIDPSNLIGTEAEEGQVDIDESAPYAMEMALLRTHAPWLAIEAEQQFMKKFGFSINDMTPAMLKENLGKICAFDEEFFYTMMNSIRPQDCSWGYLVIDDYVEVGFYPYGLTDDEYGRVRPNFYEFP